MTSPVLEEKAGVGLVPLEEPHRYGNWKRRESSFRAYSFERVKGKKGEGKEEGEKKGGE